MLNPGIKKFAIVSIIISVLFILIRDNLYKKMSVENKAKQVSSGEFVNLKADRELITNRTVKAVEKQKNAVKQRDLLLGGIFFVPNGKSYVIINGQVVVEGSRADGILVKKIWRDKIELVKDGKSIFLKADHKVSFIK